MNADTVARAISTQCEWTYDAEAGNTVTLRVTKSGMLHISSSNPNGVFLSRPEGYRMWRKMKALFPTPKGRRRVKAGS